MLVRPILFAAALAVSIQLFAAEITVSSKGKNETPQIYSGYIVGFSGVTLTFAVIGEQTPRKFSAKLTCITVNLGSSSIAILPTDRQSGIRPGRIASSNDAGSTKDTGLQRAQLQQTQSAANQKNAPAQVDLRSCHGRGKDSIVTAVGFSRTSVTGTVTKIAD